MARRVFEGAAAGAAADRLAVGALALDLLHARLDLRRIARGAGKPRAETDPVLRQRRAPVRELQFGVAQAVHLAAGIGGFGPDQDVLGLAAIGAGVHAHRAPDGAGHAGEELERSEEHTSELQSLMRISYAVFCLKKKKTN